jgi:copper chaperone CopZ
MARLTLRVGGMTCGHCRMKVEQALRGVGGTLGATVWLDEGQAEVDFDPAQARPDQYLEAVRRAGYQASPAE